MEYYSAIKRNEIELFVVRWMDLESVIQSEVSQKEKNKYRMFDLLIDTGATYSVVNIKVAQKTSQFIPVTGVSGEVQNRLFLQLLECQLGDLTLKHPECPIPLLGRDLLCKRDSGTPNLKQYPLRQEAQKRIQPILGKFLKTGLTKPCRSPYNTPILPVKKPNSAEYHIVQDLRAINEVVQDLHPVVPNPYTLLTTIPGEYSWFSVLDLKDVFSAFLLQKNHSSCLLLNGRTQKHR